ncbi:uncharacterized protein MELLADRAFT_87865 [Melampsora larici-populina 98AG31]|uniref:Uncharacterized protein n=1 Tax=Melampsora larici-populina (strain 98AG31 / pathotype 3-4-7) TaxID=747676 RepID=F4RPT1_MELLP|nr:uncharacterized protein MELLADRAFT_87865 [Melampsora larici-populina 98AG31]EGG05601.1 hypothetical protein MELLADRAFT_87865 [Melampsora larici-populina 98AG31]
MMAGAREEDRRYMAKLVHKEIVTLHQELSNQNASHDVTMTNTEDDILASEIQALRATVQALESTMHKQQNTVEQYSQKVELLEYIPRISPLKSTGDDTEIDGAEDLLEQRVSAVESSLFSAEAEAQREAIDAKKFAKFQEQMLNLIKAMVEDRNHSNSAERRGHQSEVLESEEPKLDLEKEFNSRFSTFRQTIDDQVEKWIAITIARTSGKEKASELHDNLRSREEENRRQISEQAKAIIKMSTDLSFSTQRHPVGLQISTEADSQRQVSNFEAPLIGGGNLPILQFSRNLGADNRQSGSLQSSLGEVPGERRDCQVEVRTAGTLTSGTEIPNSAGNSQHTTFLETESQSMHNNLANHPSNSQTPTDIKGPTRTSLENPNVQTFSSQPRLTPASRKSNKWRRSSITPKKPKGLSLRQERLLMSPQVKEADEQTAGQVQKHFRLMAGVDRCKADFPKCPTLEDLENLPELTVDYKTAPLGEAVRNLIRPDQLQPTWKIEEMELTVKGMHPYFRRRLQQYSLPYIGSSIARDVKADDWNRRVLAFCTDTFNRAYAGQEYHVVNHDPHRIMKLMKEHIEYRLKNMRKYKNQIDALELSQKRDRQQQRRLRLAIRRKEVCEPPEDSPFSRFSGLFEDEQLCSSDESDEDVLNEDRVRHTPIWRSSLATSLVENIDRAYQKMRQDECPKRPGRKPAKHILSNHRPEGGKSRWPAGLPKDCYNEVWLRSLDKKDMDGLEMKEFVLENLFLSLS